MTRKGFLAAGHLPTLVAALLYFDVSFMTWVLLGPLAPFLRDELHLTATGQGLLTAIPLLGGSAGGGGTAASLSQSGGQGGGAIQLSAGQRVRTVHLDIAIGPDDKKSRTIEVASNVQENVESSPVSPVEVFEHD